jgi:hypothetical protein
LDERVQTHTDIAYTEHDNQVQAGCLNVSLKREEKAGSNGIPWFIALKHRFLSLYSDKLLKYIQLRLESHYQHSAQVENILPCSFNYQRMF